MILSYHLLCKDILTSWQLVQETSTVTYPLNVRVRLGSHTNKIHTVPVDTNFLVMITQDATSMDYWNK